MIPKIKEGKTYFSAQFVEVSLCGQLIYSRVAWLRDIKEEKQFMEEDIKEQLIFPFYSIKDTSFLVDPHTLRKASVFNKSIVTCKTTFLSVD